MEIIRAIQIARREWRHIKTSLEMCGEIGELHSSNNTRNKSAILVASKGLSLVRNLIEMENKLPIYGYFTPDAAYVFTTLASKPGKRLGLVGTLAQNFGSGYSLVWTGCLNLNATEKQRLEQTVFFNLSFPHRGPLNWKFNSTLAKVKLKAVFEKFVRWQGTPEIYIKALEACKGQLGPPWITSGLSCG